jgi:hypothetical protein
MPTNSRKVVPPGRLIGYQRVSGGNFSRIVNAEASVNGEAVADDFGRRERACG